MISLAPSPGPSPPRGPRWFVDPYRVHSGTSPATVALGEGKERSDLHLPRRSSSGGFGHCYPGLGGSLGHWLPYQGGALAT